MRWLPQVAVPQFAPGEVITIDTRGAEPGNDALPISRGRRSAWRILVGCLFRLRPGDAGLPEQFASAPLETGYRAPAPGIDGLSDEDATVPNDRRGTATVGQRHTPGDVLVRAPVERKILLFGQATAVR